MQFTLIKISSSIFLSITSVFIGYFPVIWASKYINHDFHHHHQPRKKSPNPDEIDNENSPEKGGAFLSCLLNFGGGVLLANSFCHWLPEVRQGLRRYKDTSVFFSAHIPSAEIIMVSGFFLVHFLEEMLHGIVKKTSINKSKSNYGTTEISDKKLEKMLKSGIRTFFVVTALSFHSIVAGIALSLESTITGVWINFGAIAMHKFVIAFSVGVELLASKVSHLNYFISVAVFGLAPTTGVLIGLAFNDQNDEINDLVLQILQGVATGTIIYVIFFEIFPKAREIGGFHGFKHILSMMGGFLIFLPSLLFHSD